MTSDYPGANPTIYQGRTGRGYYKNSNGSENDWTDLINLCDTVSNTPDNDYAEAVRRVINVEKWMRNLAFYQLVGSAETSLQIGRGDDYALYRGVKDPRFILLGHDLDTIMSLGAVTTRSLFVMCPSVNSGANVAMMDRFMKHPEFVPIYYRELNDLLNTTFRPRTGQRHPGPGADGLG